MTIEQLKNELAQLVNCYNRSFSSKIKANDLLFSELMRYTSTLNSDIKIKTRVYRVLNGIDYIPKCMNCGKEMLDYDIKNIKEGYRKYCCQQCAKDSSDRKALYRKTCMRRYGVYNASSSSDIKLKRRKTNIERFGVDNPSKSYDVMRKIQLTNLERYCKACSAQSATARAKTAATNLERYGATSFSKTRQFKEKTIASNIQKFGVAYPNQDPAIRRRAQKRYTYNGIHFDSAPELAFFIYAADHGISVEYQPDVCFEFESSGKKFKYQPDFRCGDRYIELKGLQFFEGKDPGGKMINPYDRSQDDVYEAKHKCMVENGIEIITDYSEYLNYVGIKYGKDYLRKFKNR